MKIQKAKGYVEDNQFDIILRLFYILRNFPFTTSETMGDY